MAYDFSQLRKYTKALQEMFKCSNCKIEYTKKWCKDDNTACLFCQKFLPMRDNYSSILKDIEIQYYRSGECDQELFYKEFLNNLKIWANRFSILPTNEDVKLEEELRGVKNWTRDFWH
jgi:hypothetical protein